MAEHVQGSSSSIPFELGYGLTTLTPISSGIPVYTAGDTMWALSNFSQAMKLTVEPPNSTGVAQSLTLQPALPVPVHAFSVSDADGIWSIRLSTNAVPLECAAGTQGSSINSSSGGRAITCVIGMIASYDIPIHFVKPSAHPLALGLSRYSLRNDKALIGFSISSTDQYDQEACLSTNQTRDMATVRLPKAIGVGDIEMVRSGNNISVRTNAAFNSSFAFWTELYHPFSFNINGTAEFVSTNLRAATTAPIIISSPGSSNTTLSWETAARMGRYEGRAFFQTQSGLFVQQVRLLLLDRLNWLSLDSCQLLPVESSSVSYLASLAGEPSTWPSSLLLMYRVSGVEGVSTLPVKPNISKVNFVSADWLVPVDDPGLSVQTNDNVQESTLANGSLYLVARAYPLNLTLLPSNLNTVVTAGVTSLRLQVLRSYTAQNLSLSVGRLMVHVLNQESPSAGVVVTLTDSLNRAFVKTTGIDSYTSFYVLGGKYNVTAKQSGLSRSYQVTIINGQEQTLDVQLLTPSSLPQPLGSLQTILLITGIIGVILNVLVWVVRPRLSR